jgi:hypothetical protein
MINMFSTLNCSGLFDKLDRVSDIIDRFNIRWLFATETWWDTSRRIRHPVIASSARARYDGQTGRCSYGCALLVNSQLQETWPSDIVIVATDPGGQFLIFNDCDIQIIGLYLRPVSGADHDALEEVTNTIDRAMAAAEKKPKTMRLICGDLNLRLPEITGDGRFTPPAHREILARLRGHGFDIVRQDTWRPTYRYRTGKSIVDYWMANEAARDFLSPTCVSRTGPNWYCRSDHVVLTLSTNRPSLRIQADDIPEPIEYKRWRIGKLQEKAVRDAYYMGFTAADMRELRALTGQGLTRQEYIEVLYGMVMAPIIRNAETVIGWDHRRKSKIQRISLSQESRQLLQEQREYLDLREREDDLSEEDLEHIQRRLNYINDVINEDVASKRKAGFQKFCSRADRMPARVLSKVLCSLKGSRAASRNRLGSESEDMEGYAQHFYNQYNAFGEEVEVPEAVGIESRWGEANWIRSHHVVSAISRMPNGKAPGRSKFVAELLKPIKRQVAPSLAHLFSECLRLAVVPEEWHRALLVPIPKTSEPSGISEHRPISLLEHVRKLFELCIGKDIYYKIDSKISISQGGFREERGTLDQVCALQEVMLQHRKSKKRLPIVAFLDIKAAYDSVDRKFLYQALERMGIPERMIRTIRVLSEGNHSRVVVNGRESSEFPHRAGVMQGSVLSPTLYSAFINGLAVELKNAGELALGNSRLSTFLYADDMAIVADKPEEMQSLLDICERYSIEHRIRFNPRKCEVFGCDTLRLYGEILPVATNFKYLGVWFKPEGIHWVTHVAKMIEKAENTSQFFGHLGYNGTGFKERTKLTIFKTFLRPIMEYAIPIMPVEGNKGLLKKLDSAQHRMLCRMFGVHWTTSKANIRALTAILPFANRHEELRAKWGVEMIKKDATFAIQRAHEAHTQRPLPKSCFRDLQESPLFQVLAPLREHSYRQNKLEVRNPFWQAKHEYRVEQITIQMHESNRPEAFLVDTENNRPTQLLELSQQTDAVRRLSVLWMLNRLMGEPPYCARCNRRATLDHLERSCLGRTHIDRDMRAMEFTNGAAKIQRQLRRLVIDERFLHWMAVSVVGYT